MSSLKDQIAKDVQEIKEDNEKHFGTKLPGNDNKEQEQTIQELSYSQMIMGSLASMVWGVQNIKDDVKVKALLNRKNNIYDIVKSIKGAINNAVNNGVMTVNTKLTKETITLLKTNLSDPVVQEIRDIPDSLTEVLSDTADTIAKSIVFSLDLDNKFKGLNDRLEGFDAGQNDIYQSLFVIGDELRSSILSIKSNNYDYTSYLKDIKDRFDILNDNITDLYVDIFNNSSKENKQSIDLNITGNGFEDIKNLLEEIEPFNSKVSKELKGLNGLYNLIEALSSKNLLKSEEDAEVNLNAINNLLTNNKVSLRKIFDALDKITAGLNINADLESLSIIIDTLITIISIDKDKINISGLKTLLKVTDVDKGEVKTLIDNLIKISGDAQINEKNIIALGSFFESITKVGDIGLIKRYKIKSNLKYFSKFITKDIPAIFNELVKVSADSESEDKLKAIAALGDFFLGIVKIADIDSKRRKQLKSNLKYIKDNLLDALTGNDGIITLIIKSINEASDDFGDSLKALDELFDKLFKVADFSFKDLFLLELKLSYLSNIFKEHVIGDTKEHPDALIRTLVGMKSNTFEAAKERINLLNELFESLEHLFDIIPSFKDLLFTSIKLNVINNVDLKLLDLIIQHINSTPDVDTSGFQSKIQNIKDNLDKVKELNDFIIGLPILNTLFKLRMIQLELEKIQAIIDYVNLIKVIKKEQLELFEENGTFIQTILSITRIGNLLKYFDGEETTKKLQDVIEVLKYLDTIIALWPTKFNLKGFDKLKSVIDPNIRELIESVNSLDKVDKEVFETINNTIKLCQTINKYLPSIINEDELDEGVINTYVKNISSILTGLKQIIDQHVKNIDVDDKLVSNIENLIKLVKSINKLAVMSITAKISSVGLNALSNAAEKLKGVVDTYKDINEEDLKKALDVNKQFTKLLMVSAAILIAGTLLMGQINISKLVAFTAALTFFTCAIALTYKIVGKYLDDSIEIAESFIHLMALSSLILLVGAFFTRFIDVKDLFAFTCVLSTFLLAITGTFLLISKVADDIIDIAKDIIELIKVSAAILMIGGLYMKLFGPKEPLAFAILLGGFIFGIATIFVVASKLIDNSISIAKEFSYLIAISALSLILGALFISKPERAFGALAFAILLGGFIFGIIAIFKWANKDLKIAMQTAMAITALVAISALVLMIGGLFMQDLKRAIGALAFALLLEGFIALLLYTFKKNSDISKAIPVAVALGIVTIISSIALLTGGWLIMNNTDLLWAIPAFGVILWGFTEIMCKTLSRAAKNAKDIYIGASIMAILGGLVFEMGWAFKSLIETSKMIDDWWALIGTVAIMGVVLLGLFGLAYLIANSGPEAVGMIALATAIIAALIGCVALMGIGIQEIAKGIEDMAKVSHMDVDLGNLAKLLIGLAMLTGPLMGLGGLLIPIGMGAISMKALRVLLSDAAFVVQSYASLTIPMYDENGKFKGFKQMSEADIVNSMNNVELVVTSLFNTVRKIYNENPDMFKFSITSLLTGGGGTIFGKVAVAGKGLAAMLSALAVSVKQWCDLTIPIYEGEKIIGYKTLDNDAFIKAGQHIQMVVTCLGQAVLDVYKNAPNGMFDYQFGIFGDSPFEKVSKSMLEMGKMLSSVAVGVKEWSDLKIPVYKGTEIVGYQTLGDGDFLNAALNIYKVLICIGNAIVDIVEKNPKIFGDDIFTDGPAIVAAKAMKLMGETLNLTALAVASYASGEFPIFDKDGKIIDKLIVNEGTIEKAKTAIQDILECIGNAIVNVIKNDTNDIFDDGVFSDSPAVKAAEAIKNMSDALNNTITAIEKLSKLEIDDLKAALDPSDDPQYADNVYHKLVDVLNFTVSIYKLFAAPDKDSYGTGFWGGSLSFAEYLDKYVGDIEDANEALETFTEMLSKMLSNYVKIGDIVAKNAESLQIFEGGINSKIYKYLNNSLTTVSSIITLFTNEDKLDLFDKIEDNEEDINEGLSATSNICLTLLSNIVKVKEISDKLSGFNLRKIIPLINSFNACIKTLNTIGTNSINKGPIRISLPDIDAKSLYDKIKTFSLSLNEILKIAEYSERIGEEGYNTLRDGILTLSAVTEKVNESEGFKNHTNDLKNYIKTINSIDLSKLMNLHIFVNSLNALSRRLGNLDNLTDAIANKLSAVLFELVKQLTKADASINNAHQLQEKRKKLIEESMNKISNLMSQHMIVEITQVSQDNLDKNTDNQSGRINGNNITNNEGYKPEESANNITDNKLQSPENVGNDKKVNVNKRSESDLDEFKRWMINEYTNDLVKKIKQ